MRTAEDGEIAGRIRAGDHAAFSAMFLKHYDNLCRFAESYVRHEHDAEEIVEGVLARVWEQRKTFDPAAGIGPYLYAAVRNRSLNTIRDTRSRLVWEQAHAADVPVPSVENAAEMIAALEREDLSVVLRRAIESLPEHRRSVVMMRWFGGLTHAEIAAALNTSANAVEIQLRRALKELAAGVPAYLKE